MKFLNKGEYMERLSFVIPCYGSENTICGVVDDVESVMQLHPEYDYEIVLVNDCSPDNVWGKISKLHTENKKVKAVNLARNFGQHAALMAGYNICEGDYIVTIDDDGQTPVDQTFFLLDRLKDGFDVVYGKYGERKDNNFRKFGTTLNNFMLRVLVGKPKDIHLTSYFVARRYIIDEVCKYKNAFPYIWGLILRTTKNITNVTIRHSQRSEGESGYTLSKLLGLWLNGFTAFSVKPLRISAGIGLLFAFLGFIGVVYTVAYKIWASEIVAGYSSLMSVILIIGGLILLSLGLIGEYVGRIYMCINSTPQFVVKELLGVSKSEEQGNG